MGGDHQEHVSVRFARLLDLYRKPDGSRWGGQDLERATGRVVTRSYVASLKKGRIEHPGMDKLAALAGAMGFAPGLWFVQDERAASGTLPALDDPTIEAVVEEVLKLGPEDRELLLRVARGMSRSGQDR